RLSYSSSGRRLLRSGPPGIQQDVDERYKRPRILYRFDITSHRASNHSHGVRRKDRARFQSHRCFIGVCIVPALTAEFDDARNLGRVQQMLASSEHTQHYRAKLPVSESNGILYQVISRPVTDSRGIPSKIVEERIPGEYSWTMHIEDQ